MQKSPFILKPLGSKFEFDLAEEADRYTALDKAVEKMAASLPALNK